MRRIHRSDLNQSELVRCARQLGMLVTLTGRPTDAFVFTGGIWAPTEFKGLKGRYTSAQLEFQTECAMHNAPMFTWRTTQDIIDCANAMRGRA